MKNNLKAIFCDLDGTLLRNSDKLFDDQLPKYLKEFDKHQISFIITTGRLFEEALTVYKKLNATPQIMPYIISSNGAQIYNLKENKFVLNVEFEQSVIEKIFIKLQVLIQKFKKIEILIFTADGKINMFPKVVTLSKSIHNDPVFLKTMQAKPEGHTFIKFNKEGTKMQNMVLDNVIKPNEYDVLKLDYLKHLSKIVILTFDEHIDKMMQFVSKEFAFCRSNVSFSSSHSIEISATEHNKGSSVIKVCELLNISLKQALVLGDSGNDLSMLNLKEPYGVAPSWAHVLIQNAANEVFDGIPSKWILNAFNKLILNKK